MIIISIISKELFNILEFVLICLIKYFNLPLVPRLSYSPNRWYSLPYQDDIWTWTVQLYCYVFPVLSTAHGCTALDRCVQKHTELTFRVTGDGENYDLYDGWRVKLQDILQWFNKYSYYVSELQNDFEWSSSRISIWIRVCICFFILAMKIWIGRLIKSLPSHTWTQIISLLITKMVP